MATSVVEELRALRELYEENIRKRAPFGKEKIRAKEAALAAAAAKDYATPYIELYAKTCHDVEEHYAVIRSLAERENGGESASSFSVEDYSRGLSPRPIPKGGVEERYRQIYRECKEIFAVLNDLYTTPEEADESERRLCQMTVDLKYIVANAPRLIAESGLPDADKKRAVEALEEELARERREYENAIRTESLDCYREIVEFCARIRERKSMRLGGRAFGGNSHKYLMGFGEVKLTAEERDFAVGVLGLEESAFSAEPVLFEVNGTHSTLLIRAEAAFFQSKEFVDLVEDVYLSIASELPARELLFCGIESGGGTMPVGTLGVQIKNKLKSVIFNAGARDSNETGVVNGAGTELLAALRTEADQRTTKYGANRTENIFSHNLSVPRNRDKFILCMINRDPVGLQTGRDGTGMEELRLLATRGGAGIITVICEATDGGTDAQMPRMNAETLGADCMEIHPDGRVTYNGREIRREIHTRGFSREVFWTQLSEYFDRVSALMLDEVLDAAGEESLSASEELRIPIGIDNGGEHFELRLKCCTADTFGLIVGPAGSGKSAFLHTLILSAASRYSPEELRFCLADFKSERDSPEFSNYRKIEGRRNLYIPHVEYLLVNGTPESAFELLDRIERMAAERIVHMKAHCDFGEVKHYNRLPDVLAGRLPRIPTTIFIIDEYNAMLKKCPAGEKRRLAEKLGNIVKTVRSSGIGVILCGQNVDSAIQGDILDQMGTRISLRTSAWESLAELMNKVSRREIDEDLRYLSELGHAVFSTNCGETRTQVRVAYAGSTGSEPQLRRAERIRERFGVRSQVEVNSEELFPIGRVGEILSLGEEREGEESLPLGVASASMLKVSMALSRAEEAMGYLAFSSTEKLYTVERNVVFAALERWGRSAEISYLSFAPHVKACFGEYFDAFPFLKKQIRTFVSSAGIGIRMAIAEELRRLDGVRRERQKRYEETGERGDSPILAVMHGVSWLSEDGWVARAEEPVRSAAVSAPAASAFSGKGLRARLDQLAESVAEPPRTAEEKKTYLTERAYRDLLAELYFKGPRVGIFLFVTDPVFSDLRDALQGRSRWEIAKDRYALYGSATEKSEGVTDVHPAGSCIYASNAGIKVRCFDYSPAENADWWQELEQRLRRESQ